MESQWFAVRVRSRHEKVVASALDAKGYTPFLPLFPAADCGRGPSERRFPVFPGYVFCSFNPRYRLPILTIPGVVMIVSNGKELVPVPEEEIEALKIVVRSGLPLDVVPFFNVGDRVEVCKGPLCGLKGIVISRKECRQIVVSVELFQRSVAVLLHEDWLVDLRLARTYGVLLPGSAA